VVCFVVWIASGVPYAITAHAAESQPSGDCPQPRFTGKAPQDYLAKTNPVAPTAESLAEGERLFTGKSKTLPCAYCHGVKGDGKGYLAAQYDPRPRNFLCTATINGIEDGQLFWIIQNGSPGTAMPPSGNLTDIQIWSIVNYLRKLAQPQ
jgi:mono/diheme cytochrome c family protein